MFSLPRDPAGFVFCCGVILSHAFWNCITAVCFFFFLSFEYEACTLGHFLSVIIFLLDSGEHSLVCIPVLPRFIVPWLISVGGCRLLLGFCIPAFWFLLTLWTCDYASECDVRSMFQNTCQWDLFLKTKLCNVYLCSVVYVFISELVFTFGRQYINFWFVFICVFGLTPTMFRAFFIWVSVVSL